MATRHWFWIGLSVGLAFAAGPAHAGPDPLLEWKQKYRCPLADRLERLYDAGDPAQDRDRFIVVALPAPKRGYVQCRFHDRETTNRKKGFHIVLLVALSAATTNSRHDVTFGGENEGRSEMPV